MSRRQFLANLPDSSACILWPGAVNSKGYGCVTDGTGASALAHRVAYEMHVGPIPEGLTIDHLCRQKRCTNVAHMEVVTRGENVRRQLLAQTRCKRGHELVGENVRLQTRPNGHTYRVCRECTRARRALSSRSDIDALVKGDAS